MIAAEEPEAGTVRNLLGSWEKRASISPSPSPSPLLTNARRKSSKNPSECTSPRKSNSTKSISTTTSTPTPSPNGKKSLRPSGAPKLRALLQAYEESGGSKSERSSPARRRRSQTLTATSPTSPSPQAAVSSKRPSVLDRYQPKKIESALSPAPTPAPTRVSRTVNEPCSSTMPAFTPPQKPQQSQKPGVGDQYLPTLNGDDNGNRSEGGHHHPKPIAPADIEEPPSEIEQSPQSKSTPQHPPPQQPLVKEESHMTLMNLFLDELSVMAMLIKPSPSSYLGVDFAHRHLHASNNDGDDDDGNHMDWRILISALDPKGLLGASSSDLRVGQTLLALNGIPANEFESPAHVMQTLSEARQIVLVATKSVSVTFDMSSSPRMGIRLGATADRVLYIQDIATSSDDTTMTSTLQVGMKVIALNDRTDWTVTQANYLLQGNTSPNAKTANVTGNANNDSQLVTILAIEDDSIHADIACTDDVSTNMKRPGQDPPTPSSKEASLSLSRESPEPQPIPSTLPIQCQQLTLFFDESSAVGTVVKPTRETRLGIGFTRRPKDWRILISVLTDDSLLRGTPLRLGQTLLAVNGRPVTEFASAKEVRCALEESLDVHLVATKSVLATVHKNTPKTVVGISLRYCRQQTGGLVIDHIARDGLFGKNGLLEEGMKVVAINDKPCPASLEAADAILEYCAGPLTIVGVMEDE